MTDAIETLRAWLPPMGATSIPEEPIKPAQANELHSAVNGLEALVRAAEALRRPDGTCRCRYMGEGDVIECYYHIELARYERLSAALRAVKGEQT